jgi:cysteinyl-tRNA synthetase
LKERFESLIDHTVCSSFEPSNNDEFKEIIETFKNSFEQAMDDDFNTPEAIAVIFEFVNNTNKYLENNPKISMNLVRDALQTYLSLANILTIFQEKQHEDDETIIKPLQELLKKYDQDVKNLGSIAEIMNRLIEIRQLARNEKQWNIADSIRDELLCLGFEIQDTSDKTVWRKR